MTSRPPGGAAAWPWRVVRFVFGALLALVVFIEEWGWKPLAAAAAKLARLPPIAWLEARIRRVSPRVALVLFLLPATALFPLKLLALWLIDRGDAVLGIVLIVGSKLVGTALVGRLFILVEAQLRTFAWFVHVLDWWHGVKARVKTFVRESAAWRAVQAWRLGARRWWRQWKRQWRAR